MIVGWCRGGLEGAGIVPFLAHIGLGCKEAPTCLCQSQYPRVGPSFVPIAEHCIP